MTHRTHRSWNTKKAPRVPWGMAAAHSRQAQAQQALAEGQNRPEPGLTPPKTYEEHFDEKVAEIKARQEQADGSGGDEAA